MSKYKKGKSKTGKLMHYSVGAVIKRDGKYLLINRVNPPLGFAGIAGHVDEGENEKEALKREVEEEGGLKVSGCRILFEEELDWSWCSEMADVHYWYLFECNTSGEPKQNHVEEKSIGWYSVSEIKNLKIEPVWEYWFKKLKII